MKIYNFGKKVQVVEGITFGREIMWAGNSNEGTTLRQVKQFVRDLERAIKYVEKR